MRLHWFSPLLPDRTDIGHFTGRVLRELATRAEVTVWTETDCPDRSILPEKVPIHRFDPHTLDYSRLNAADVVVYNIGNNGPFHAGIYQVSKRLPGVTILHEADLQGLFLYLWLNIDGTPECYPEHMREHYGILAQNFARARLRSIPLDHLCHQYPITHPVVEGSIGVVSHTPQVTKFALEHGLPVRELPLPFNAGGLQRAEKRAGRIRLIQFGYLNPHRGLQHIFEALSKHSKRSMFNFDIYGQIWDLGLIESKIAALDLGQQVKLRGFVDESELNQAIAEADLVFNLRFPTVGEASGTQLRIWSNAAPSVVTNHGWFGNLPDNIAIKVQPRQEVDQLTTILDQLAEDRHCFDELGLNGRELLVSRHSPRQYATDLIDFLSQAQTWEQRFHGRKAQDYLNRRRFELQGLSSDLTQSGF